MILLCRQRIDWNRTTWILGVVSQQLSLLRGQFGDSTALVNSLSQWNNLNKMRLSFEDAVASCCGDIVAIFFMPIRNEIWKFVELKLKFFSFNTFDVSQIFWQRVAQPGHKHSYAIFLKGLCFVSVCWILNNALCSMSYVFFGF